MGLDRASDSSDSAVASLVLARVVTGRLVIWLSVIVMIVIVYWLSKDSAPGWLLLTLTSITGLMTTLRFLALRHFSKVSTDDERSLFILSWFTLGAGLGHGALAFLFPYLDIAGRLIVSLCTIAFAIGTIMRSLGFERIYAAYTFTSLIPFIVAWVIVPSDEFSALGHLGIALLITLILMIQPPLAKDLYNSLLESENAKKMLAIQQIELDEKNEQLRMADNARTRFMRAAGHDIKQPLQALALSCSLLLDEQLSVDGKSLATKMDRSIHTLSAVMEGVIDVSRYESPEFEPQIRPVNLVEVLLDMNSQYQGLAESRGLKWESVIENSKANIQADNEMIYRLISNLISNSIRYTDVGQISVVLSDQDSFWLVRIIDTGRGIAETEMNSIFLEFYQVKQSNTKRNTGMGLGLSVVKSIIAHTDVEFEIYSTLGKGTECILKFPKFES